MPNTPKWLVKGKLLTPKKSELKRLVINRDTGALQKMSQHYLSNGFDTSAVSSLEIHNEVFLGQFLAKSCTYYYLDGLVIQLMHLLHKPVPIPSRPPNNITIFSAK
jgi:hypothetical protein